MTDQILPEPTPPRKVPPLARRHEDRNAVVRRAYLATCALARSLAAVDRSKRQPIPSEDLPRARRAACGLPAEAPEQDVLDMEAAIEALYVASLHATSRRAQLEEAAALARMDPECRALRTRARQLSGVAPDMEHGVLRAHVERLRELHAEAVATTADRLQGLGLLVARAPRLLGPRSVPRRSAPRVRRAPRRARRTASSASSAGSGDAPPEPPAPRDWIEELLVSATGRGWDEATCGRTAGALTCSLPPHARGRHRDACGATWTDRDVRSSGRAPLGGGKR